MDNRRLIGWLVLLVAAATVGHGPLQLASAENCIPEMVETMPDGMSYLDGPKSLLATHEVLIGMAESAKSSIQIATYYVSLTDDSYAGHASAQPGRRLMDALVAATKRGVRLELVIDDSKRFSISNLADLATLEASGASVHRMNMTQLFKGGVMHSKFMLADGRSLYLGSSNFDWRSYSHVKEIGIHMADCPTMGADLGKIFDTYKLMCAVSTMPAELPAELSTQINLERPLEATSSPSGQKYSMFLAGSPPQMNGARESPTGRTDDLTALLHVIDSAKQFVQVSVMNYMARSAFGWPKTYWPVIENALRRAATERGVRVELLFSNWPSTREEEFMWYKSLNAIQAPKALGPKGGIFVKMFKVPAYDDFQSKIPFARVKHDKYVVTERTLYVGTSNWTPEYFEKAAGVGYVLEYKGRGPIKEPSPIVEMQQLFKRDFESAEFATNL